MHLLSRAADRGANAGRSPSNLIDCGSYSTERVSDADARTDRQTDALHCRSVTPARFHRPHTTQQEHSPRPPMHRTIYVSQATQVPGTAISQVTTFFFFFRGLPPPLVATSKSTWLVGRSPGWVIPTLAECTSASISVSQTIYVGPSRSSLTKCRLKRRSDDLVVGIWSYHVCHETEPSTSNIERKGTVEGMQSPCVALAIHFTSAV